MYSGLAGLQVPGDSPVSAFHFATGGLVLQVGGTGLFIDDFQGYELR